MSKKYILLIVILALIFIGVSYLQLHGIGGYWIPSIISFGSALLICIIIAITIKKDNNGYAPFGTLIKYFAITLALAFIVSTVFDIVQISMMDKNQREAYIDRAIEASLEMYSSIGMDEDQLATMEDELEENLNTQLKPTSFVLNALVLFFVYFLIFLIPAAILKKNPPST